MKRSNLLDQLEQMEKQARDNVSAMAAMEGERTKLLLRNAHRQATKLLELDVSDLPKSPAGSARIKSSAGA